ncbi:MFS transporter [Serratia ficaria]|uniref:Multidrug resistance protein D n=1 Tax=Serratia ficaria TaxID=61651 RepID=A0A240AUP2_SERFI|nr:MFS transporter [Serratia ficaria]REF46556.1 Bcr/CflA subfamily drug resistance transporter [Serratia ficaria]CAI0964334.1 Multidrug resistance protein D [Serratia ficaria]CAI0978299.1 Multidrug resistance protein D [Serratia ficaria]CAI1018186.1 Multidrug resistance protein D [Serratia ficaria]CAI2042083.1 Multidrug resistance protein D [Serratia ficaria]
MQRRLTLTLATLMMMFPQIVETIYSPALTHIADGFHVSAEAAAQTLSCYFFAFAFGVVVWGRLCDVIGRRPTILAGLALYLLASIIAIFSTGFTLLLAARVLAAFGAAVGSVGTQTAIRDRFDGYELARVFSVMGIAMAVSPAVGVLSGALLTHYWGYQGVFAGLAALAALLLAYAAWRLPETRPAQVVKSSFFGTLGRMAKDGDIWRSAWLVALFNVCMFSYYQLAPFRFEALGIPPQWFGYTGLVLAAGVGIGAAINKFLIARKWLFTPLLMLACVLALVGGGLVFLLEDKLWFVLPMMLVVMAYGIAIPNILARALRNYKDCMGTAGAILGLMYYLMLAAGLVMAGVAQRPGIVLMASSACALLLAWTLVRGENRAACALNPTRQSVAGSPPPASPRR